jgi:RNA polymerase sigma factor, sigma-70 family
MSQIPELSTEIQRMLNMYPPLDAAEEQMLFRRYNLAMSVLANALARKLKSAYRCKIRQKTSNEPIAAYLRYLSEKLKLPYNQLWEMLWQCKDELSPQERDLVVEAERIREKLFNHNLRLVVAVVSKLPRFAGTHFEDLFYEGIIGLGKAIDHYNINEGTKFSTTAIWWIHQEVGRKLLAYSGVHGGIKISVRTLERWSRLRKLLAQRGIDIEKLSDDEFIQILNEVELSKEAFQMINFPSVLSIDQPVDDELSADDRDKFLRDILTEVAEEEKEELTKKFYRRRILSKILDDLTDREREAICLYFGFDDASEEAMGNFAAVGKIMGICRSRAQQLVKQALEKIKHHPLFKELLD